MQAKLRIGKPQVSKEVPGSTPDVTSELESSINNVSGGGQPLPESVRAFYEPRFGHDFSGVRLHTDSHAAETAKSINARAFTVGHNIAFGSGQYSPESGDGLQLLAHELTHTVQQGSAKSNILAQLSIRKTFEHLETSKFHKVV